MERTPTGILKVLIVREVATQKVLNLVMPLDKVMKTTTQDVQMHSIIAATKVAITEERQKKWIHTRQRALLMANGNLGSFLHSLNLRKFQT